MATISKKNMFNEATRVQMPAMVHLTRLGYTYFGKITEDMAGTVYDPDTNILINVFKEQFARLNPTHVGEVEQTLKTIRQELDNDDIGYSFYKHLLSVSPIRLVDFENPKNNTYHFTAEFTCKRDQDEFRPDITLFVNGLPLVFVEVKKPNNYGGMVAESKRMNQKRFPNKKFRRFLNITQLMIFSNNMEYDTNADVKFYVGKTAYSTDTWSISAKSEMSDYLYLMLFSIKPELDQKFFQGTGLKHLQKPLLKDRPIYVPEKMELEAFNRQVMPMLDIISENTRENQQLTSLRDWLLPMLMNGQATIND